MGRSPLLETEPAWGQQDSLYQPRQPVFWLTVALLGMGAFLLHSRVAPALSINVGAASLTFVLWAAYAAPFVMLIVFLDLLEPEPPAFLASAFAWGAVVACSIAMVANSATQSIMTKTAGPEFTRTWWPALSGPSTEEVLKALGVVVIVLIARRQVSTVLDGLIYGLFVGLGFQIAENIVYTSDKLQLAAFGGTPGRVVLDMFFLRGFALGLWSHAVYTALVGYGIAFAFLRTDLGRLRRAAVLVVLFCAAWGLHFLWNAPFLQPGQGSGLNAGDLLLYVAKGIPALLLVTVLYALARRREVAWFSDALRDEQADVPADELHALTTFGGRRTLRATARRSGGPGAARALRRLQRAQVRLAVSCARSEGRSMPEVEAARRAIRTARCELERSSAPR